MYEWPASIAPEPNNYEFISSRSIFFFFFSSSSCWLAEHRIHSEPASAQRPASHFLPEKVPIPHDTQKAHVPGSPSFSGLSDCCIYLQRRLRSVSPASAPHCVSIQPQKRKADGSLPFQTAAGRQPKQKAPSTNRRAPRFKRS